MEINKDRLIDVLVSAIDNATELQGNYPENMHKHKHYKRMHDKYKADAEKAEKLLNDIREES